MAVTVHTVFLNPLLLGHSRMIALTHERRARRLAKLTDIKIVRFEFETPETEEAMYWHPRLTTDPAHRWLCELLMKSSPGTE